MKAKNQPTAEATAEAPITAPAPVAEAPKPAAEPKTPITKVVVVIEGHEGFTVEGDAEKVQRDARRKIRAHGLTVKNAQEVVDGNTRTVTFAGEAVSGYKESAPKEPKAPAVTPPASNGAHADNVVAAQLNLPVVTEGQADPTINSDEVEYTEEDEKDVESEPEVEEAWD